MPRLALPSVVCFSAFALVLQAAPARANSTLQYWALLSDAEPEGGPGSQAGLRFNGHHGHAPFRCGTDRSEVLYGRYALYTMDPELPIAIAETVPIYQSDGCAVFFDIVMTPDAISSMVGGELNVRLDICKNSHHGHRGQGCNRTHECTFAMDAGLGVDEPVDTLLDDVAAGINADIGLLRSDLNNVQTQVTNQADQLNDLGVRVDGVDTQVGAIAGLAPSCAGDSAVASFDVGAQSHTCTPNLATQAELDAHTTADQDLSASNELQSMQRVGNVATLSHGGGSISIDDGDADPTNELQNWGTLPGIPAGFSDGVDNVNDADADPTNELQALSRSGTTVSLSNGGSVSIADNDNSSTNELQNLSFNASTRTLSISGGNSVVIPVVKGELTTTPRGHSTGSCNPANGSCGNSCSCSCSHGIFGSCSCSCNPAPCTVSRSCTVATSTSCGATQEFLTGVLSGTWNGGDGVTGACGVTTSCVADPGSCSCSCSGSVFGGSCSCSCSNSASCSTPSGTCTGNEAAMCARVE